MVLSLFAVSATKDEVVFARPVEVACVECPNLDNGVSDRPSQLVMHSGRYEAKLNSLGFR